MYTYATRGAARIISKPGAGTTVEIYLPRALIGNECSDTQDWPALHRRRSQTVLVIDDQDDVREVVVAQLETLGHRAVPAADGRLGLDLLQATGSTGPIDILPIDYAMPGVFGPEVAHAARRAHPDMPIVLMTGYANARALVEPLPPSVVLLKKRFKMQRGGTGGRSPRASSRGSCQQRNPAGPAPLILTQTAPASRDRSERSLAPVNKLPTAAV
jgi:CheY-like chemotaxis protein